VEFVGELLQAPLARYPHEAICNQLYGTFDAACAAWSCNDGGTTANVFDEQFSPGVGVDLVAEWQAPENFARHC
jgi:hypothetical protein